MNETRELAGGAPIFGEIELPGDKSISHRALLLGALSRGELCIRGISSGDDVLRTQQALKSMGIGLRREGTHLCLQGGGIRGPREPADVLDCGNSGTTARLLIGLLSGQPFFSVLTGDRSLRSRPMARVAEPLGRLGARILGRESNSRLPMAIVGGGLLGGSIELTVASAQVKTALLLAGLFASSELRLIEPTPTRDHTERLLELCGLPIRREGASILIAPAFDFEISRLDIPGDFSSAAFFLVLASVVPGSDLWLRGVGINPGRIGLLHTLKRMGANLELHRRPSMGLEPVADIRVRYAALEGVSVGGRIIPSMIDEIPVLCVAAAFARGRTTVCDAAELRLKESNRIAVMGAELRKCGIRVDERPDGLVIKGGSEIKPSEGLESHGDHRIAMALSILACAVDGVSRISGTDCVGTSFPSFFELLEGVREGA